MSLLSNVRRWTILWYSSICIIQAQHFARDFSQPRSLMNPTTLVQPPNHDQPVSGVRHKSIIQLSSDVQHQSVIHPVQEEEWPKHIASRSSSLSESPVPFPSLLLTPTTSLNDPHFLDLAVVGLGLSESKSAPTLSAQGLLIAQPTLLAAPSGSSFSSSSSILAAPSALLGYPLAISTSHTRTTSVTSPVSFAPSAAPSATLDSSLAPITSFGPTASCQCFIDAPGGVQLRYWAPDGVGNSSLATANLEQVYARVDDGFTFTSPSVYVVYTSLQATQSCPWASVTPNIGPSFSARTLAYSSSFLAYGTLAERGEYCNVQAIVGGFHTIDFSDLYYSPIATTTSYPPGCPPYVNPRVSLPAELTNIAPEWASCEPRWYGAYDPPSIMSKASQLVPDVAQITEAANFGATVVPALAEAAPAQDLAQATPAPDPDPAVPPQLIDGVAPSQATPPTDLQAAAANNPLAGVPVSQAPSVVINDPENVAPDQLAELHQALQPTPNIPIAEVAPKPDLQGSQNHPIGENPQPQGLVYNPQGNGFEPAPAQNAAAEQNPPAQPVVNNPPTLNEAAKAQKQPAPLVVDSDGGVLVDSGSQSPRTPQVAGNSPPQQANVVASDQLSVGADGKVYAPPAQLVNDAASPSASVANDGQIYAAPVNAVVQPAPPLLKIGGQVAQVAQDGALQVGGKKIPKGSQAVVNGALISNGPNDVVVDGVTHPAPIGANPSPAGQPLPNLIHGQAVQVAPNGGLIVGDQSISKGGQATVAGGSIVSVGSDHINIGGSSFALPGTAAITPVAVPAPLAVAGQAIRTASNGGVVVAGQTITQGGHADVSGSLISIGSTNIVVGSSTYVLPANNPPPVGGQYIRPAPNGGLVVAGQTINAGKQVVVSGTTISAGSSNVVIAGSTYNSPSAETLPAALSIGGQLIHTASDGGLIVAGQTLTRGVPASISGTLISIGSSDLIIGSSTYGLPSNSATVPTQAPLLIAGNPVKVAPGGGFLVAGQTITPGEVATVSGITISVGSSAVVLNNITHAFNPTETAIPAFDGAIVLTAGEAINEGVKVVTYSGPAVSAIVEGNDVVMGTSTLPLATSMTGPAVSEGAIAGLILSALESGPMPSETPGGGARATGSGINPDASVGSGSRSTRLTGICGLLPLFVALIATLFG